LFLPLLFLFSKAFFSSIASRLSTFLASSAGGQVLWYNATVNHHFPDSLIVAHIFRGNLSFTVQILLLHIDIGHFGCEVLGFNADGRKEGYKGFRKDVFLSPVVLYVL
jgi:hypothetical protein